ncbi:hypothetical protein ACFTXK_25595 [Streptomyces sp. NPDC056956]|jgi:hypothetical protein|uniref:hypothetical protein n=1 Tax=unclassified Streptomyces TaxID=2593676 RepID=UPI003631F962
MRDGRGDAARVAAACTKARLPPAASATADRAGPQRRQKPENVRRLFRPSSGAIAALVSLLAPGGGMR